MPVLDVTNQEIRNGSIRVAVPRARVEVSWPDGCTHLDLRRADITAQVQAQLDVPANACPVQPGSVWRFYLAHAGRRIALDLLATSLGAITPGPARNRRLYDWTFLVVALPSPDKLDLFPAPAFLRGVPGADGAAEVAVDLGELAAWIAAGTGEVEAARFNAEGGLVAEEA